MPSPAGIEARGFIFGPPIALGIGAKFVCIRKPKKLPGECPVATCPKHEHSKIPGSIVGHNKLRFGATIPLCHYTLSIEVHAKTVLGRTLSGTVAHAGETISEEYSLEYGTDKIEMHLGAVGPGDKVLLVDDLVATGGTLGAGIRLIGTPQAAHRRLPPRSATAWICCSTAGKVPLAVAAWAVQGVLPSALTASN